MKTKLFSFIAALCCFMVSNQVSAQVQSSTEGQDFWMTFMRADQSASSLTLSLLITAKENCTISITNPYSGYSVTFQIIGNASTPIELYAGPADASSARSAMATSGKICYAINSEQVDSCALHITSTSPISVVAINHIDKSMDATSILPTQSLGSEYVVQCYMPSAHSDASQGSHFAIVATEDNTVVDITPTTHTYMGYLPGEVFTTDTLQKGQVYYVYTGNGEGDSYDLSGTHIIARNGKRIAVFEGNPHTNIPYKVRDRDHLYSQAYPTVYWGRKYAVTSSLTTIDEQNGYWERIDKVRVMASVDETVVLIDGDTVHKFDFATNPKHYFEFDFGARDSLTKYTGDGHPFFEGSNHIIETSCPCAVHQFSTSNRYDHDKITGVNTKFCNGDGTVINVMPLDYLQREVRFIPIYTPYSNAHFLNIVTPTNQVNTVLLDGISIANQFTPMQSDSTWSFARITGLSDMTHVLSSATGVIANVYGCGSKEAYAYSLGAIPQISITNPNVTINGLPVDSPESQVCVSEKTIDLYCVRNIQDADKNIQVKVDFGDYTAPYYTSFNSRDTAFVINHSYPRSGIYNLNIYYYESNNVCVGQTRLVNVMSVKVVMADSTDFYFTELGKIFMEDLMEDDGNKYFEIVCQSPYSLRNDFVNIHFDQAAEQDGFRDIRILNSWIGEYLQIVVPDSAQTNVWYEVVVDMSLCGTWTKTIPFMLTNKKHITYLYNSEQGYAYGDTICGMNDTIHFEAIGYNNYHFERWSDGVTDNPRAYVVTSDVTFEAIFAANRSGKCGDDLALNWTYDSTTKTLTISGSGTLNSNYTFGLEAPTSVERLIIDEGVTTIGNSAFANYATLKYISIAASVSTIYEQAFYNCTGLKEIYSYRDIPSVAYSNTFDGINKFDCTLHVLSASVDMYQSATGWRDFYYVQTIDATEVTEAVTDVDVAPTNSDATVTWPTSTNAFTYTIVISKDGVVFCTLIFNANGQLTGIAFAPNREANGYHAPAAVQTSNGGLRFTVTGLSSATNYHLTVNTKDTNNLVIASYSTNFTTTGDAVTAFDDITKDQLPSPQKIFRDGQIYILRDGKTYDLTGKIVFE